MNLEQPGSKRVAVTADPPEVLARIHAELDLVDLIARQISRTLKRAVQFDDLLSAGREGLFLAARSFDPSRGVPFRSYANIRIRGAMLDGVRHQALSRRAFERLRDLEVCNDAAEGFAEARQVSGQSGAQAEPELEDQLAALATACAAAGAGKGVPAMPSSLDSADALEQDTPEEQYARAELHRCLHDAVGALEPTLATVLRLRHFEGLQLDEIATRLGLDRSWVGRLDLRAQRELTYRLRERL